MSLLQRWCSLLGRLGGRPWRAAALGVVLTLPSLAGGFAVDDHFLRLGAIGHEAVPGTPRAPFDLFSATYPSDRLLLFSGIGGMGLLAHLLPRLAAPRAARAARWAAGALLVVHSIVAPLLLPLRSLEIVAAEGLMEEGGRSLPTDAAFMRQQLILVSSPQLLHGPYALARRASLGEPLPASVRILATIPGPMTLHREDDRTLLMRVPTGLLPRAIDRLLRSRREPLEPGDKVELEGFHAEVLTTGPAGPTEVRFRFAVPLEAPDHRWLAWEDGAYRPFTPPAAGESVVLGPG